MTPFAKLVTNHMQRVGLSRAALVKRLGWANTAKGLRHLDKFLASGQPPSPLLKGLPDVLGLDPDAVEAAAATTRQRIADAAEAAARARFRPHIEVLAHRADGKWFPAFAQMFAYGLKILALPDGFDWRTAAQQVRLAAPIVRRHYGVSGGELPVWGTITGYRLQRTFDHAVVLNADGTVRDAFNRGGPHPAPELRIRGKRVPTRFFG